MRWRCATLFHSMHPTTCIPTPCSYLPRCRYLNSEHIEAEVFAAGKGDYDSSHLLMAALLERPAIMVRPTPTSISAPWTPPPRRDLSWCCACIQRLLNVRTSATQRGIVAMKKCLEKLRDTLGTPPHTSYHIDAPFASHHIDARMCCCSPSM